MRTRWPLPWHLEQKWNVVRLRFQTLPPSQRRAPHRSCGNDRSEDTPHATKNANSARRSRVPIMSPGIPRTAARPARNPDTVGHVATAGTAVHQF